MQRERSLSVLTLRQMSRNFSYDLLGGRVEEERDATPPTRSRRRDRDRDYAQASSSAPPEVRSPHSLSLVHDKQSVGRANRSSERKSSRRPYDAHAHCLHADVATPPPPCAPSLPPSLPPYLSLTHARTVCLPPPLFLSLSLSLA